jgi:uncharacterized membrane protein HdeD (DUF308 family)
MTHRLLRTPWAVAARGGAAFLFGLLTLVWPSMTVTAFVAAFAALAIADGAAAMIVPLRLRRRGRDAPAVRDPLFLLGAAGAALGVAAALWTEVTMQVLLTLVAAWGAVSGASHMYVATQARPRPPGWWLLTAAGAAALALAVVVVLALAVGEVRVGWVVGVFGITSGALLGACAWRLRQALARRPRRRAGDAPSDDGADDDADDLDPVRAGVEARAS